MTFGKHNTAVSAKQQERADDKTCSPVDAFRLFKIGLDPGDQIKYRTRDQKPYRGHQKRRYRLDRIANGEICRTPKNVNSGERRDHNHGVSLLICVSYCLNL